LKSLKASVDRSLKNHNFGRTNQFEVAKTLEGLQEKFRVLNNDSLADALNERLKELSPVSNKWTPEILSLLIQLSDKPVSKTIVEDLDLSQPPADPPPLTWEDLDASDPLPKQDGIWEDVDFAEETSDEDDYSVSGVSSSSDEYLGESDTDETSGSVREHLFTARGDEKLVKSINDAQFWNVTGNFDNVDLRHTWEVNARGKRVRLTEMQIVKEFIFMLQGLPTSLFRKTDGSLQLNISYSLRHSSEELFHSLMGSFADIAVRLDKLRDWAKLSQDTPVLQTFHQGVEHQLAEFDADLSKIQTQLLTPLRDVIISLGALFRDVLKISKPVLIIEALIHDVTELTKDKPFAVLEVLFDATCSYQVIGDQNSYLQIAKLFLECFQTYIKPVRQWIESGRIDVISESSLIVGAMGTGSLNNLWRTSYQLKETPQGVDAPKFLLPVVKNLFTTGKSVMFLGQLGISAETCSPCEDDKLSFDNVCNSTPFPMLTPFSELFKGAIEDWFEERSDTVSSTLRQTLDQRCGLWSSLDALEQIYFARNLSLSSIIDHRVFDRIDRGRPDWKDRYLLTELIQGVFSSTPCVSIESITVSSARARRTEFRSRSVKMIGDFSVDYALPWSVANILSKDSIFIYQRVSTFLMQIRRAKYILVKQRLQFSTTQDKRNERILGYALRHRLLWFTNTLYSYLSDIVLTTSLAKMRKALSKAVDIDSMILVHCSCLEKIEDQCLLSKQLAPIFNTIISILDLCIGFSAVQTSQLSECTGQERMRKGSTTDSRKTSKPNQELQHHPPQQDDEDEDFSTDDDEDYESAEEDHLGLDLEIDVEEISYTDHLRQMRQQFDQLCGFVTVGLRGVSRSGARQAEWEILAEKLEWKQETIF
jgi:gamma-tubulin complex component 5